MALETRIRSALAASGKHLLLSAVVAVLAAFLVFCIWFPYPFGEIVGGKELFLLLISVDVMLGPALTLVVFDPKKPRRRLWRDLGTIAALQFFALAYGLASVYTARPVFVAFEGNRFRVVRVPDIDLVELDKAAPEFRALTKTGPRLLGVKLLAPTDPDFPKSVTLSMQGLPPAYRPERWVAFEEQRESVIAEAKSLSNLVRKYPAERQAIEALLKRVDGKRSELGYLPLESSVRSDWSIIVDLRTGEPVGYLPLDGW